MTKEQVLALKAMMYTYRHYGANRLADSSYLPDWENHPEESMGFGEAYNICQEMIDAESKEGE